MVKIMERTEHLTPLQIEEIRKTLPRFMNLRTDFAFKKVFGTDKNKHVLLKFLNYLFSPKIHIKDIIFKSQEVLPFHEEHRKIIYDVYGHTDDGKRVMIETQQASQTFFINRSLIYTGMAMVHQAKKGDWNYKTDPVLGVFVMNFHLKSLKPKLVRRAGVTDLDSHELLTDAELWYYIDLSQMRRKCLDTCKDELERWIYCLKNMDKFKEKPEKYTELGELFDASETMHLAAEDVVPYSQSEQRLKDEEIARLEYGLEMAKKGEKRGEKRGEKKGILKGMQEMARNLKALGVSSDIIAKSSGLSPDVIASL